MDPDPEEELEWSEEEENFQAESSVQIPSERSGHIAVVDGNRMYVWGGYTNLYPEFNDVDLSKRELWIYNTDSGKWSLQKTDGCIPPGLSGSCAVRVDEFLYLFGGHHHRGNINLVFRLLLRGPVFHWDRMDTLKGLAPTSKDKLGCWVYKNSLVYFGGYGYEAEEGHRGSFVIDDSSNEHGHRVRGWNNHIHILDLDTLSWSQPITEGRPPTPRAAHACATMGNRGYVFGGRFMDNRLNDLYYINLDTWEWNEMRVPQLGPVGRSWHSFTPVSSDHIFLFGGFTTDRKTLSDGWIYCVSSNEWKPFEHSHKESARLWHTACAGPDGKVYVFGGCHKDILSRQEVSHTNKILIFSVQPPSLLRCCVDVLVRNSQQLQSTFHCLPKHLFNNIMERIDLATTQQQLCSTSQDTMG